MRKQICGKSAGSGSGVAKRSNQGKKQLEDGVEGIYEALPRLRDVPVSEKPKLFIVKLSMCYLVFDFSDPSKHVKEKKIKRKTLKQLLDYVATVEVKFNDVAVQALTEMVALNLFRTLPSLDPHIQLVYEILLRFLTSPMTDTKLAQRYIDNSFLLELLHLFDSQDQREREYLKTILHRVYRKFIVHRHYIRQAINNIFDRVISETEKHNGISELLEIHGCIINGFSLPLKEEHKLFLVRALIPLHKPKCVSVYHQQLSYCIVQFVKKDFKLALTVIEGLLECWPVTNSSKEVMFLEELEEVLKATQAAEFQRCMVSLFQQIAQCLNSSHFLVVEKALFLWNDDHIRNLITQNREKIMSIVSPVLERNRRGHWNKAVEHLTPNARKVFCDIAGVVAALSVDKSVEFTLEELAEATDNFNLSFKIGQGGFGTVYYAELRGEKAAIKKMDMKASEQFLAELKVLTRVNHVNLVRLIGYCVDECLFLVYEYVENGNLEQHLHRPGRDPLPWDKRVQIAQDSARGLEYIHEHTVAAYIHRDIKSANILIDQSFRAKVADFGLTKLAVVGGSLTRPMGTFGYMAPEIVYGEVSVKVDVYAFGVVLYQLISAKRAVIQSGADSRALVSVFEEKVFKEAEKEEALRKIIDPRLGDNYSFDSVYKMAKIGRACTQVEAQLRPSMSSIVVALSTANWDVANF